MFRIASRLVNTIPSRYVIQRPSLHSVTPFTRAFASIPASHSRFSYQHQHQQQQQQQQHQHRQQHDQSWSWRASSRSSSSSRIILFSSTAALVAATGLTMYSNSSSHVHAAPLTHNHPANPIVLATPKDQPEAVIKADLVIAPRWRRAVARFVDVVIQSCIIQLGQIILPANIVAIIVTITYDLLLNVYNDGQTLGKMVWSVRTVKDSGERMDLSSAFLNWLGTALFTILGGIDTFWSICNISGDYKCLHNVISGTIVVDTRELADEEKREAAERYKQDLVHAVAVPPSDQ